MRDLRVDDERRGRVTQQRLDDASRDRAFQIVRHEQRLRAAAEPVDLRDDGALDLAAGVRVALVVDARDLLVAFGDDPHLLGGRPRAVCHEPVRADAGRRQLRAQRIRRGVDADDPHQRRASAERRDVVRDVRRAAQPHVLRLEADDGDRRLRRNARHASDDEAIEHHVADHEHGESGEPPDEFAGTPGVERRQRHSEVGRAAAAGSVTTVRKSISTSESPKLYSNSPAVSSATTVAIAVAANSRCPS